MVGTSIGMGSARVSTLLEVSGNNPSADHLHPSLLGSKRLPVSITPSMLTYTYLLIDGQTQVTRSRTEEKRESERAAFIRGRDSPL